MRRGAPLLAALTLAACASAPPPTAELGRAREALGRAESAGAGELAPVDYKMARESFDGGRALIDERENAAAKEFLQKAEVRAELALAKATAARLRNEVQKQEAENQALRRELLGEGQRP
ncbi:MAG: DUF4398 domain-containing protein [Xanthomonadales bacterium]|nr:DUF4398 domain-containing protein [Xanthomonadales bacterium]